MKTSNFIRYLHQNNCKLLREGGNHSIFQNELNKKISSVQDIKN